MNTQVEVKTLKRSTEAVQTKDTMNKAPKIIHEKKLALNKSESKFISIGIDIENWTPMLRLSNVNNISVPISCQDWDILTNDDNIKQIKIFFKSCSLIPIENVSSGLKITGQLFNKSNILQFKKKFFYVCLAENSMMRLLEILPLINMYIREIEGLDLKEFYNEVLDGCIQIEGDAYGNFEAVAQSLAYHQGINLLYMYPEVIKQNLYDLMQD